MSLNEKEKLCRIKLTLQQIENNPEVSREFVVPLTIPLRDLHRVIQESMGWKDEFPRAHHFRTEHEIDHRGTDDCGKVKERFYAGDYEAFLLSFCWHTNEDWHALCELVSPEHPCCEYEYNYRARWRHDVRVLDFDYKEPVPYPIHCLKGERACPPEDCNGVYWYKKVLEAIRDPNGKTAKQLRDPYFRAYVGCDFETFDPDAFSLDEVNEKLHAIPIRQLEEKHR